MAPPRKHETDVILDATRALVLADGPRAASVAAIAKASGAPAGTLYHRFGNRDGVLTRRPGCARSSGFRSGRWPPPGTPRWTPRSRWVSRPSGSPGTSPRTPGCCCRCGPRTWWTAPPDAAFGDTLAAMNAPLAARVSQLAERLYGTRRRPGDRLGHPRRRRPALRGGAPACRRPPDAAVARG